MAQQPRKFIHLSFTPIGDGGAIMERRMEFNSQEEMTKFIETEKKEAQDRVDAHKAALQKMKEDNKGSVWMSLQETAQREKWSDPGTEEVQASIDTFDVAISELEKQVPKWQVILDLETGAPQELDLAFLIERSRQASAGLRPPPTTTQLQKFAAVLWLNMQMLTMHVRSEVRARITSQSKPLTLDHVSIEQTWSKVIGWYNGFVKTGWEAVTFGPKLKKTTKTKKRKAI